MALQSSGQISLDNIQTEIGGSNPISISEYYGRATGLPSTGQISLQDFYGKAVPPLQYFYLKETIVNPDFYGANTANDYFGSGFPSGAHNNKIALCDKYAVVGTPNEDDVGVSNVGVVYIFDADITSSTYGTLLRTIENPNDNGGTRIDNFGSVVAVTDNYLVVGASEEDTGASNAGIVYIFNPATGALLHTLDNPNPVADDYFGNSVAITDNYVAVGCVQYDSATYNNEGRVYIFSPSTGSLLRTIDNPKSISDYSGGWTNDVFGKLVSLTDNHLVVTCRGTNTAGFIVGGFYIIDPSNGNVLHSVISPTGNEQAGFGVTLDTSDKYIIVGAYELDGGGASNSGGAWIYDINTAELLYTLTNPNDYGTDFDDYFGSSVSITDQFAVVGARVEDSPRQYDGATVFFAGVAYVYDLLDGSVIETILNPSANTDQGIDYFGTSVAIHGNIDNLQIWGGAPYEDVPISNYGAVHVFRFYNSEYRSRALTYLGATAPQDVTGFGFDPDMFIIKSLSTSTGYSSWLFDTISGVNNAFAMNSSASTSNFSFVSSITDGISFSANNSNISAVGVNHAVWGWDAGGSSVTNNDGDLTSTVRANPAAGFSVVRWTSTSGAQNRVGHGLGITPEIVIQKRLGTYSWVSMITGVINDFYSYWLLDSNGAITEGTTTTYRANDTTFPQFINTSGNDVMAYCFASVPGVSKIGFYTGTGTTNTVRVSCGFKPSIIMIKGENNGGRFYIYDTTRDSTSPHTRVVELSTSNVEINNTAFEIDTYQTGFYIGGTSSNINTSGRRYIFMAFK